MVDQLVIDARTNLAKFGGIWLEREKELEDPVDKREAKALGERAYKLANQLNKLIETDRYLDKEYDKIKKLAIA